MRRYSNYGDFVSNRKLLGQNFLRTTKLASHVVSLCGLSKHDSVFEIGAGSGILTDSLSRVASNVVANEIDSKFAKALKLKFSSTTNVQVLEGNFLDLNLKNFKKCKVVGNIPFGITSQIMRKLFFEVDSISEAYLIIEKSAFLMFGGKIVGSKMECFKSASLYPFYKIELLYEFKKSDFYPEPSVETVLVKIAKRDPPLIEEILKTDYSKFLRTLFNDRVGEGLWLKMFTRSELNYIKSLGILKFKKGLGHQDVSGIVKFYKLIKN